MYIVHLSLVNCNPDPEELSKPPIPSYPPLCSEAPATLTPATTVFCALSSLPFPECHKNGIIHCVTSESIYFFTVQPNAFETQICSGMY
jgi:hypothetical protein